eukprot:m.136932 g.136932  ORF g.136932 m.136932 type:complete len:358 (-) comp16984_c0_seq5:15-1088(-)
MAELMAEKKQARTAMTTGDMVVWIPGFVDLQVNGYRGVDFSSQSLTEASFATACHGLFAAGTFAFLPTVITSSMATYRHVLPLIARAMRRPEFQGRVLGIHLEGPFISKERGAVGCHNPEHAQLPSIEMLETLCSLAENNIKVLTMAAELDGAEKVIAKASSSGIVVALGHQLAGADMIAKAEAAGAVLLTHLGNGIPNMLHRHHNPLMAGIASNLGASIITDGYHLPPSTIKVILRAKKGQPVIVVSDAAPVAGLAPGKHECFGKTVIVEHGDRGGRVLDAGGENLAGSGATMLQCINYLTSLGVVSPDDVLQLAYSTPLALLGLNSSDLAAPVPGKDPVLNYSTSRGYWLQPPGE